MAQMDTLAVRVTDAERAILERLAVERGVTMGAVVRDLLRREGRHLQPAAA
jgi:hypothetical protein